MPDPVADEGEVVIRVRDCGVCGSDLHTYVVGIPARYGHEYSGDIVEVGPGVDGWKVGDRVAAECIGACGGCFWCARGQIGLCESFDQAWSESPTGFATYTKTGANRLHRLPPHVSYEEGALVEPAAVALHAVALSDMKAGDAVAVLGLGPIGQLVARLARISGAGAVYATEASESRIGLAAGVVDQVIDIKQDDPVARIIGLTDGLGPDVVFECAGAGAAFQQSLALARKGGTIVLAGVSINPVEMVAGSVTLRELTIRESMVFSAGDYASALGLIAGKKLDVTPVITDVLPLDEINAAFGKAVSGEGGKILVEP